MHDVVWIVFSTRPNNGISVFVFAMQLFLFYCYFRLIRLLVSNATSETSVARLSMTSHFPEISYALTSDR